MVGILARAALVACTLLALSGMALAQDAASSYLPPVGAGTPPPKPPQAASKPPQGEPRPQSAAKPQSAAATPKPGETTAATPAGPKKTIGLISVVGDSFMVKTVGLTVFGNEQRDFPVAAWKFDDRVAAKIASLLTRNFKVRRIAVPAGTYRKYETAHAGTDYRERQRKLVMDFAGQQKCDFYLLVTPGGSQVSSTNQSIGGLGVLRWQHPWAPGEHVFALSQLTAFDSQFKAVRTENGSIGQDNFFMVVVRGPSLLLEDARKLPEAPEAAARDPRAKELTWELLEKSLAMTVPKLFAVD